MSVLAEYYESGNAPHEALGRAARRLRSGGAIYLGAGIGAERQQTPAGEKYHVTSGAGDAKPETFIGPLSAVIRAFTIAGSSTNADSPGGATSVTDPAAAARLRELADEEAEHRNRIDRYTRQLAAKAAQPFMPGRSNEDDWERRRVEELKADLRSIAAERAKLLAAGTVQEVEQARPGTNFTKIPAANVKRLSGIIDKYRGMAHPFAACVRDQIKHGLSEDHANRRCAVVKDLAMGTTKWRKGGSKVSEEAQAALDAALGRLAVVESEFGLAVTMALVEGIEGAPAFVRQLAEGVTDDLLLLSMAGHPLALAAFGIEEAFAENKHPRDFLGQFKAKVAGLKMGETAAAPGGVKVKRTETGFEIKGGAALGHHESGGMMRTGKPAADEKLSSPNSAAMLATTRSLRSRDPNSLGGARHYQSFEDYEREHGKPGEAPKGTRKMIASDPRSTGAGAARAPAAEKPERKIGGSAARQEALLHGLIGPHDSVSDDALRRMLDREFPKVRHRIVSDKEDAQPSRLAAPAAGADRARIPGTPERAQAAQAERSRSGPAAVIGEFSRLVADVGPQHREKLIATMHKFEDIVRMRDASARAERANGREPDKALPAGHVLQAHFAGVGVKPAEVSDLVRMGVLKRVKTAAGWSFRLATAKEAAAARRKAAAPLGGLRESFSAPAQGGGQAVMDAKKRVKNKPAAPGAGKYDESKHKRAAAGSTGGGRFVTKGSSGEDVRAVQQRVGAKADGKFGAKTREAVMEFQKRHGLQVDGVVGHQTAVALAGGDGKTAKVAALKGSDREKLKRLRKGGPSLRARGRRGSAPERARGGRKV